MECQISDTNSLQYPAEVHERVRGSYPCSPVVLLEGKCTDGKRAGSPGAEAAVSGEVHGGPVQLLGWRVILALEVQRGLIPQHRMQLHLQVLAGFPILDPDVRLFRVVVEVE